MEIETRALQMHLFEMMREFHRFCICHQLKYYMLGGTCLGAIRHSGFIPWDDDIDVGMPRSDYERFCMLAKDGLSKNLELRYYKNKHKSPFHFVKLVDRSTTLVENAYNNYVEGVYIDVFPLDGMKEYSFWGKIRARIIWFSKAIIIYHFTTNKKKKFKQRIFKLLAKLCPISLVHVFVEHLMTLDKSTHPELLCNFFGAWEPREIISNSVFGKPTLYPFENDSFYGPENADAYLKSLYGDYMKMPPPEKRICRHDFLYVNLNFPYEKYEKENM